MKSIMQTEKFNKLSEKYSHINTANVLEKLTNEGYIVRSIQEKRVKNKEKEGFQQHIIRLQRNDINFNIEGLKPELILRNSHDGSSAFRISLGIFRLICANGLTVGRSFQEYSIRHTGDALSNLMFQLDAASKQFLELNILIEKMLKIRLNFNEVNQYSRLVAQLLKPDSKLIDHTGLLQRRRKEDINNDLFTVLNVIQENALRGNFKFSKNGQHFEKARCITGLDSINKTNNLIWNIGAELVA